MPTNVAAARKAAEELLARGDALQRKIKTNTATEAEVREFEGVAGEIDKLNRQFDDEPFEGFSVRPNGGAFPGDRRSTAKPLEARTWEELCQRTNATMDRPGDSWENADEYFRVLLSRRHDPRLTEHRANVSHTEGLGGFSVPSFVLEQIFDGGLSGEAIRPRSRIFPMQSNVLHVPAWSSSDRTDGNVFGGFSSQFVGEGEAFTVQTPTMERVTYQAKKLGILCRVSSELAEDSPMFSVELTRAMSRATSFFLDRAFIRGNGSDEPQGLLNSPALVTVAKESGQSAATILAENVANMWARMEPASTRNATWFAHPSTLPQLMTMTLAAGTGGGEWSRAVSTDSAGRMRLMGRELVLSEHCSALGTVGDIILADLSQYAIALRSDIRIDVSGDVYFGSDESALRLRMRLDAKSLLSSAITPAQGSDSLSPFVTLATRS